MEFSPSLFSIKNHQLSNINIKINKSVEKMGALTSRQNAAIEETDISSNNAYKYPSRSGNYFGSHFIMGGERFDTPQPEAYLFGENADLNFLGSKPTAFPYPPPQAHEPTKTLKSLVNIRKESVRFHKVGEVMLNPSAEGVPTKGNSYNIEFVFDSDANCAITVYYFCTEEISSNGITYVTRNTSLTSETYHYKRGVNQFFVQSSHIFNPSMFSEEDLSYNVEKDVFPVAIHCVVEEGSEDCRQSHTTICVIDRHSDGTYVLRALKQKIYIDGLSYLLQEIYGIENKAVNKTSIDEETDDNGSECVICMSDIRDTLILPCRHLCLCNSCADSLRYQANNCPICRAPFRALLQIRAVQKSSTNLVNNTIQQNPPDPNCEHIPAGYAAVSLIEALNGPPTTLCELQTEEMVLNELSSSQIGEIGSKNEENMNNKNPTDLEKNSKDRKTISPTPELQMSVLSTLDQESELSNKSNRLLNNSEKTTKEIKYNRQNRDNVHTLNERNNIKNSLTECDDDSDAEKLSPLLDSHQIIQGSSSALHIEGVDKSIDDIETDLDTKNRRQKRRNRPELSADGDGAILTGEDSDYYTPEDPHTTILSPLFPEKSSDRENSKIAENPKVMQPTSTLKDCMNSLPDSPISGNSTSTRSSGDSYSSSSSTKQLLSSIQSNDQKLTTLNV